MYRPHVKFSGRGYGNLASISGNEDHKIYRNIEFETDELGYRNITGSSQNKNKVILLGDSFGVGAEEPISNIWHEVWNETYGLQCYNLSIAGNSPWQELLQLKYEYSRINTEKDLHVIWALFQGNDFEDLSSRYGDSFDPQKKSILEKFTRNYKAFRAKSPIRIYLGAIKRKLLSEKFTNKIISAQFLDKKTILFHEDHNKRSDLTEEELRSHTNYHRLKYTFQNMAEFCFKNDISLDVVLIPTKYDVYSWILNKKNTWSADETPSALSKIISELSEINQCTYIDLKPVFIKYSKKLYNEKGHILWHYDDSHWNKEGHSLAASYIFNEIFQKNSNSSKEGKFK